MNKSKNKVSSTKLFNKIDNLSSESIHPELLELDEDKETKQFESNMLEVHMIHSKYIENLFNLCRNKEERQTVKEAILKLTYSLNIIHREQIKDVISEILKKFPK